MSDRSKRYRVLWAVSLVTFFSQTALAEEAVSSPADDDGEPSGVVVNAHLNVLGPLQFGVTPTLEVGSQHWSGLAYFRWLSSGLYARSALPNRDHEELAFSYGVGLGGRYYLKPGLSGFNVGLAAEILQVQVESQLEKEAFVTSWLVPQVTAGYRFRFGSFLLGLGLTGGYAVALSARVDDLSGGQDPVIYAADDSGRPFASAAADIGFYF